MKNKGFTLIELLAVIVILAVIALIATPIILNVIENSKEGAFKDSVFGVIEAAEQTYINENLEGIETGVPAVYDLATDNISYKGAAMQSGKIILDKDRVIVQNVTNGEYCATGTPGNIKISKKCNLVVLKNVYAGNSANYALDFEGRLYYHWGGYLETDEDLAILGKVKMFSIANATAIILNENDEVYVFGSNRYANLGDGTVDSTGNTKTLTPIKLNFDEKIVKVVAESYNTFAITENGEVYSWGRNNHGQLGVSTSTCGVNGEFIACPAPTKAALLSGLKVVDIKSGGTHSVVKTSDGNFYIWGSNAYNQLSKTGPSTQTPTKVVSPNGSKIVDVFVNLRNTLVLLEDGTAYIWGDNTYGQYGVGNTASQDGEIKKINIDEKIVKMDVADAGNTIFAITKSGKLYSWGRNKIVGRDTTIGYAGLPTTSENILTPTIVFEDKKITDLSTTIVSTIATAEFYDYYAWGWHNAYSEDGTNLSNEIWHFDYLPAYYYD